MIGRRRLTSMVNVEPVGVKRAHRTLWCPPRSYCALGFAASFGCSRDEVRRTSIVVHGGTVPYNDKLSPPTTRTRYDGWKHRGWSCASRLSRSSANGIMERSRLQAGSRRHVFQRLRTGIIALSESLSRTGPVPLFPPTGHAHDRWFVAR